MNPSTGFAILRNVRWTVPAGLLEAAVKAGAVIVLARLLGPTEFGLLLLVFSIIAVLTLVADVGVSAGVARRLSEAPASARSTLKVGSRVLAVLLVLVAGAVVVFTEALASALDAPQLVGLRWIMVALLSLAVGRRFVVKFFEGLGRADLASRVSVLIGWAPWLLAVAVVLWISPQADWALTAHAGGGILVVTALILVLRRVMRKDVGKGEVKTSFRQLARYALPMAATAAGFLIYTQADILLVQYFLSTEEVGIYGTAVRLMDLLHVPAAAVGASAAVYFVGSARTAAAGAQDLFHLVTRGLLLVYLPTGAFLVLFGSEVVELVFGSAYVEAGVIVAIYVPFMVFKSLAGTYSLALDYLGYATLRAVLVTASASANILLNLILIPRYGIVGAAVATLVTYVPLGAFYWWMMARTSDTSPIPPRIGRLVAATSVAIGLVLAVATWTDIHIVLLALLFLITYVPLALGLETITREEIRRLIALASSSRTGHDPGR